MNIKDFKCISENNNIEEYLEFHNYVRANMEFPNWLGTFSKEDITDILNDGGKLFEYYDKDKIVCTVMYMPIYNKTLRKHNIQYDESKVGSCGPIIVSGNYRGSGLQGQMLTILENYCKFIGKNYIYTKVHKDNIYSIKNFEKNEYKYVETYTSKDGEQRNVYLKEID